MAVVEKGQEASQSIKLWGPAGKDPRVNHTGAHLHQALNYLASLISPGMISGAYDSNLPVLQNWAWKYPYSLSYEIVIIDGGMTHPVMRILRNRKFAGIAFKYLSGKDNEQKNITIFLWGNHFTPSYYTHGKTHFLVTDHLDCEQAPIIEAMVKKLGVEAFIVNPHRWS